MSSATIGASLISWTCNTQVIITDLATGTEKTIAQHFATGLKLYDGKLYAMGKIDDENGKYALSLHDSAAVFDRAPHLNPSDPYACFTRGETMWTVESHYDQGLIYSLNSLNTRTQQHSSVKVFDNTTPVPAYTIQSFLGMTAFADEFLFTSMHYTKSNLRLLRFEN